MRWRKRNKHSSSIRGGYQSSAGDLPQRPEGPAAVSPSAAQLEDVLNLIPERIAEWKSRAEQLEVTNEKLREACRRAAEMMIKHADLGRSGNPHHPELRSQGIVLQELAEKL